MTFTMRAENDYIQNYESAVAELIKTPGHKGLQHKAVLSLARAGALDFALAEYDNYQLSDVENDEDIMALGGRLSKDLYLRSQGKAALKHARDAANKYEAAFQTTHGYYSGINAATMALIADMPMAIVTERVSKILEQLPPTESLSPEDHYFVQATLAECYLLLDKRLKAQETLQQAISFDPLNYVAHASTLKQFKLILEKRQQDQTWLASCKPPMPVHYAGHMWAHSEPMGNDMAFKLSDVIQQYDIGFGYGALAAGADIVIAEALLMEGAELSLFLPSTIDSFIENSVRPFGEAWVARFKACLAQAHSCTCLPASDEGVSLVQNILSARMAMGQAILRSEYLDVSACQVLISKASRSGSLTAHHCEDWKISGSEQIIIPVSDNIKLGKVRKIVPQEPHILMKKSMSSHVHTLPSFQSVITEINEHHSNDNAMLGLHFDLPGGQEELEVIMGKKLEGTILVSESIASYVCLKHKQDFKIIFAGTVFDKTGKAIRSYTLQPLY